MCGKLVLAGPHLDGCIRVAFILEIFEQIRKINELGVSIFVVEQNAKIALEVANYGYVLENGRITIEGPSDVLQSDARIQEAYLGV